MPDILLTIAICTFNRAGLLDDALRSFDAVAKPHGLSFELLVVDNNSADDTCSVVQRWAKQSTFPVRYVFEAAQGLSRARNRAAREGLGQWIWYTDDDIYFSAGWLLGVVQALDSFPQASALAGRISLVFEPAKPHWLPFSMLPYYGLTSFGEKARWLEAMENPVGANTGFRRQIFAELGPFREDLGRVANLLVSGEESEMATRLYQRGDMIGYAPRAEVWHRVRGNRTTMSWLRKRAFWGGVSQALVDHSIGGSSRRQLIRKGSTIIRNVSKAALGGRLGPEDQVEYARKLGIARQYLIQLLRKRRVIGAQLNSK